MDTSKRDMFGKADEERRAQPSRYAVGTLAFAAVMGLLGYFYWHGSIEYSSMRPSHSPSTAQRAGDAGPAQASNAIGATPSRIRRRSSSPDPGSVTVSGHVEDTAGKRLANAVVTMSGPLDDQTPKRPAPRSPATGPDGAFSVTLSGGADTYKLRAECEGYRLRDVAAAAKVQHPRRLPETSLEPEMNEMQAAEQATQKNWALNHPDVSIEVPPNGLRNVVVTLTRSTLISGRVVDWQGTPVGQVRLFYYRCGNNAADTGKEHVRGSGEYSARNPTDAQGRFRVGNLEPGLYAFYGVHVSSNDEGGSRYSFRYGNAEEPLATVAVRADEWVEDEEIRLPHESDRFIEGVVVDENGAGIEGARVCATFGDGSGASPFSPPTPRTGVFRVEDIVREIEKRPLTEVAVTAMHEGFEPATSATVPIGAQGVRLVMMRARRGTIALRLHDARSGEPVRDAKVAIHMTTTAWGEIRRGSGVPTEQPSGVSGPDADGWYTLAAVPEGTSDLIMSVPGYGVMRHSGVIVETGKTTRIDLPLEFAGLLCTHVVVAEQVGAWRVVAQPPRCRFNEPTDNYGFSLDQNDCPMAEIGCEIDEPDKQKHRDFCLAPGLYSVSMLVHMSSGTDPRDHALVIVSREAPARVASGQVTSVEFTFPPPVYGSIEVDCSGTIRNIQVHATGTNNASEVYSSPGTGQHCSFPCVPPGTYDVTLRAGEGKRVTKQATVVSGKATSVVFE